MKAIILAAGIGKRMRPLTDSTHKTLLQVGGRTVIQWIFDALLANGVKDIVVVTGYRAQQLREYLDCAYPDTKVTYVHNERHAQTNNICSMALALDSIEPEGDVLLIECDLIFEPGVIARLLNSPHKNVALLDCYRPGMDGTVVEVADGLITEVIVPKRQAPGFVFTGKYKTLNIYRFSRDFCAGPFKKLLDYYIAVINENDYYELVLGILIYLQQEPIHAEILDGEKWAEIDDPNDIEVARYVFDSSSRKATLDRSFGGYWNYEVLDFAFIRNMYFPNGAVDSELRNSLPALVRNYGSAQSILDQKLANFLLCDPARVTALNGASQAYPVLESFFEGKCVLMPNPAFGEYARCFPLAKRYADCGSADMMEIERLSVGCGAVVFINPNNPTGTCWRSQEIHAFAAAHPEKTVLCDESFIDFSGEPALMSLLERAPLDNAIVIKSLSKTLGVPGIRLGFAYTGNSAFREALRRGLPVWNLNSIAEHFLEVILKHRGAIEESYRRTREDREEFAGKLSKIEQVTKVWPSAGNFLLIELACDRKRCAEMADSLLKNEGIYVKDVSRRFAGDRAHLRLAVRLPDENSRLINALSKVDLS